MTDGASDLFLQPLGLFAEEPGSDRWRAEALLQSPALAPAVRDRVIRYLDGCPVFLAWTEHTRDEIGSRFVVPGGSAIASDGQYYWRLDATAYIREYGITVPPVALEDIAERNWLPPDFDEASYLRIYAELETKLVRSFDF
ncbi:hypothetical protein [Aeromicrobium sp.]|uniref:hypothetical protein n=1 Tax=Aeromicrobium sp. TaxID=1871063 RepID=UPI003511933D